MREGKHVVLCIDDDQDFLDSLRLILEAHDFVVIEADSAEAGLKAYKTENPDVVLCDLMMEEIDAGDNFARDMKALGNKVPVFMLSSVGDAMNRSTDYTQLGLAGMLQKPIDPDRLVRTIRSKLK
ncbi:MAG: response regulator [Kiritimatiellae bacterium]|nr:response regulator [Kiritimatiellia bacterium]